MVDERGRMGVQILFSLTKYNIVNSYIEMWSKKGSN